MHHELSVKELFEMSDWWFDTKKLQIILPAWMIPVCMPYSQILGYSEILGVCVFAMTITRIRCISIGNKYQSHRHNSLSNRLNWLVTVSPSSQQKNNKSKVQHTISDEIITADEYGLEFYFGECKNIEQSLELICVAICKSHWNRNYSTNSVWMMSMAMQMRSKLHTNSTSITNSMMVFKSSINLNGMNNI